ncbi:MAG: hypothetical protein MJ145_03185 [Clostridia bacterium]|nr:hypothetical protein [Clostridia bacterium]
MDRESENRINNLLKELKIPKSARGYSERCVKESIKDFGDLYEKVFKDDLQDREEKLVKQNLELEVINSKLAEAMDLFAEVGAEHMELENKNEKLKKIIDKIANQENRLYEIQAKVDSGVQTIEDNTCKAVKEIKAETEIEKNVTMAEIDRFVKAQFTAFSRAATHRENTLRAMNEKKPVAEPAPVAPATPATPAQPASNYRDFSMDDLEPRIKGKSAIDRLMDQLEALSDGPIE